MSDNVNKLLNSAVEGELIPAGTLVTLNQTDLTGRLSSGMGINVGDTDVTDDVKFLAFVVDDSSSIRYAGNTQVMIDGHDGVIEAIMDSKQEHGVFVQASALNSGVLYPFRPLSSDISIAKTFSPNGMTPLRDRILESLARVVAKVEESYQSDLDSESITAIISDGDDNTSKADASDIEAVITPLLRSERHIVIGIGIYDGPDQYQGMDFVKDPIIKEEYDEYDLNKGPTRNGVEIPHCTNFRAVYRKMGIPDQFILTPGNSHSEIRRAFGVITKSAIRATQSGGSVSDINAGGFGD